ncbi:MAG: thioredoxin family protein [bacterium]
MKRNFFMFVLISILGFTAKGFCENTDSVKTIRPIIPDTSKHTKTVRPLLNNIETVQLQYQLKVPLADSAKSLDSLRSAIDSLFLGALNGSKKSAKTVHTIIRDSATVQVVVNDSAKVDSTRMPILMDFGGNRCKNCIITKKRLEKIEKKFRGKAKIISIDVNKEKELTKKYKILLIPTLVFLDKNGKEVYRKTGLMEEKAMSTKLEELTK